MSTEVFYFIIHLNNKSRFEPYGVKNSGLRVSENAYEKFALGRLSNPFLKLIKQIQHTNNHKQKSPLIYKQNTTLIIDKSVPIRTTECGH